MGILKSRIHTAQSELDEAMHCNGILSRFMICPMEKFNAISETRLEVRFRRETRPDLRSNSRIFLGFRAAAGL